MSTNKEENGPFIYEDFSSRGSEEREEENNLHSGQCMLCVILFLTIIIIFGMVGGIIWYTSNN